MKGKSSNLIAFFEDMVALADEGRPVDAFNLDFSKACDPAPQLPPHFKLMLGNKHCVWYKLY